MPLNARQELLAALLSRLGVGGKETFKDRLTSQKVVYFLQHLGLLGGYSFSWYVYGPYSPRLTRDLYALADVEGSSQLPPPVEAIVANFESKLGPFKKHPKTLELLASVHFLATTYAWDEPHVQAELKKLKPHFSAAEIHKAWANLTSQELL